MKRDRHLPAVLLSVLLIIALCSAAPVCAQDSTMPAGVRQTTEQSRTGVQTEDSQSAAECTAEAESSAAPKTAGDNAEAEPAAESDFGQSDGKMARDAESPVQPDGSQTAGEKADEAQSGSLQTPGGTAGETGPGALQQSAGNAADTEASGGERSAGKTDGAEAFRGEKPAGRTEGTTEGEERDAAGRPQGAQEETVSGSVLRGETDAAAEGLNLGAGADDEAREETEAEQSLSSGNTMSEDDPRVETRGTILTGDNIAPARTEFYEGQIVTGNATLIGVKRYSYSDYVNGTLRFDTGELAGFHSNWTACGSTHKQAIPEVGQTGEYRLLCTEVTGPDEEGYLTYLFAGNMTTNEHHWRYFADNVYGWLNSKGKYYQNLNVKVYIKKRLPGVQIRKTSEFRTDMSLQGAVYRLTGTDGESSGKTYDLTTGADGTSDVVRVLPGTYRIEEIKAPEGFLTAELSQEEITVSYSEEILWFSAQDRPAFAGVRISKRGIRQKEAPDGDAVLSGALFAVRNENSYSVADREDRTKEFAPGEDVLMLETDASGNAQCAPLLQSGTYSIREVKAPQGYLLWDDPISFTVCAQDDGKVLDLTEQTFHDPVIRGGFFLRKGDLELEKGDCTPAAPLPEGTEKYTADHKTKSGAGTQGDAELSGASFELINRSANAVDAGGTLISPGGRIAVLETDENGEIRTKEDFLPYGSYELKEISAPEGYLLRGENLDLFFTIREEDGGKLVDLSGTPVLDDVIRFDLELVKYSQDDETAGDDGQRHPVKGVVFDLYLVSSPDVPYVSITTDERGVASTVDATYPHGRLPYGVYRVSERDGTQPEGLAVIDDFLVDGTKSGDVYDGKICRGIFLNDRPVAGRIRIRKADSTTMKTIPLRGASFQIFDASGHEVSMKTESGGTVSVFETDDSGFAFLPQRLKKGSYTVRELSAPDGYLLGADQVFTVSGRNDWENVITWTFTDSPSAGKLKIVKKDADSGKNLAGAVFELYADENIVTPDGTVRLKKGESAGTVVTGKDGTGESGPLWPGKYHALETRAPEGFVLSPDQIPFEIEAGKSDGTQIEVKDSREKKETESKTPASPGEETPKPSPGESVKTGDSTPLCLWAAVLLFAAASAAAAAWKMTHEEQQIRLSRSGKSRDER